MKFRVTHLGKSLALLGFAFCSGSLHAANLLSPSATTGVALYCGNSTTTVTSVVKTVATTALASGVTIVVTAATPLPAGLVLSPSSLTLNSGNSGTGGAGVTFTLTVPTCAGVPAGANAFTLTYKAGGVSDATVTGTINASALTASPASLSIACAFDGGSKYVSSSPQTVTVGASAAASFASLQTNTALVFTKDPTPVSLTALTTATFNVTAPSTASGGTCTAGSTTIGLATGSGATAVYKVIPVTIQSVPFTPLTSSPSAPALSYIIGSGVPASATVTVGSTRIPSAFFSVDTTTLPAWLTVSSTSGSVNGRNTLTFTTTGVADTLTPGPQPPAHVHLKVSGYGDLDIVVTLTVSNPAAILSVVEGTVRNLSWAIGSAIPTPIITAISSGSAIPYTLSTSAGQLSPSVTPESGLAYGFGTTIPVIFSPQAFASAQPGNVLTGAVILTWGGTKTITVTFNVTVTFQSSTATLSSISPTTLPTAGVGQTFTVTLYGSGFVPSTDPTQQTIAGIVKTTGTTPGIVADANVTAYVANASTVVLTITNPAVVDTNLPFATANSVVKFGVCNPQGASTCAVPTGTVSLTIGAGPTFNSSGVVSASTFLPVTTTVAPYDILSIFGSNFCTANGTGCTPGQLLYGNPTAPSLIYPTFLTPDANGIGAAPRMLSVTFSKTGQTSINAPLLFATNSQINLLVPSGIAAFGGSASITVNFGAVSSAAVPVTITATDPGIFTVNSAGTGDGAILDVNFNLISNTNPAAIRPANSDVVQIYMTGLGNPVDGTSGCITLAAYEALLSPSPSTLDGVVLQSSLLALASDNPPCLTNYPTTGTKIGNVAPVALGSPYTGWVAGSVAGLYQVNLRLPANGSGVTFTDASAHTHTTGVTGPMQLPVVVGTSQPGVSMWVVPQLTLVAPTALTGTNGTAWASTSNVITGTATAFTAVPAFMLPTALTIDTTGAIAGTPTSDGYYVVTANGTDASTPPVTGKISFTLSVAAASTPSPVTLAASSITPTTYPAANAAVTTITAGGSVAPYTYTLTSPSTIGLAVDPSLGVVSTPASLPAGTYEVTITATDSTATTPLTNTIQLPLTVALALVSSNGASVKGTAGQANAALTTIQSTGQTGAVTFSLSNPPVGWFAITNGVLSTTSSAVAGTYYLTINAADGTPATSAQANAAGTIYIAVTIQ